VITVGSFDFPESMVLAGIYGDALKAKGFPVRILPNLGSRELVDPALMSGLIQVVPEYAGSALQFISLGRLSATSDVIATNKALAELTAVLNTVSARLDSASLRALDALVEIHGQDPRQVAARWLHAQGLPGQERADR
jgi:osmoprotectant transport system substrate-binding protein